MKYAETKKFANELRELAGFIETHGVGMPSDAIKVAPRMTVRIYLDNKEDMAKAAKTLARAGMVKKTQTDWSYDLTQTFGDHVELEVWASRSTVCTRKQTGTKLEEKTEYVKTGEMVEKPVYEWECDPLLAAS